MVLAVVVRAPRLDRRPMHTDEAVQAGMYLKPMLAGEPYRYNAEDGHGPMLVYSTRVLCWLTGVNDYALLSEKLLRWTPLIYSILLVLLLPVMGDGLGRWPVAFAALLTALSPLGVFFSRYYIMEMPLLFFSTAMIAFGWRYVVSRRSAWLILAGASAGFMHATKETAAIHWIAVILAVIGTSALNYFTAGGSTRIVQRGRIQPRGNAFVHVVIALAVGAAVSFTLFSSFFRDLSQPFDSVKTYVAYASRASGTEHAKPWSYYLHLLLGQRDVDGFFHTEIFIVLLAGIGALKAVFGSPSRYEDNRLQRFFTLYAFALICGYSMIAYKTPWCILTAEHAIVVLAGLGAATLWNIPWGRIGRTIVSVVLSLGLVHLVFQVWEENFGRPADPERNPFVYGHTSPDLLRLVDRVNRAIDAKGGPERFAIMIYHPEGGWPLPWYFRRLPAGHVGALTMPPEDGRYASVADVVITSPEWGALLGALVAGTHIDLGEPFEWRRGVHATALFRKELLPEFASKAAAKPEKPPAAPKSPAAPAGAPPAGDAAPTGAPNPTDGAPTPDGASPGSTESPAQPEAPAIAPPSVDAPAPEPAPSAPPPAATPAPPPTNDSLPAGAPFSPTPDPAATPAGPVEPPPPARPTTPGGRKSRR